MFSDKEKIAHFCKNVSKVCLFHFYMRVRISGMYCMLDFNKNNYNSQFPEKLCFIKA